MGKCHIQHSGKLDALNGPHHVTAPRDLASLPTFPIYTLHLPRNVQDASFGDQFQSKKVRHPGESTTSQPVPGCAWDKGDLRL